VREKRKKGPSEGPPRGSISKKNSKGGKVFGPCDCRGTGQSNKARYLGGKVGGKGGKAEREDGIFGGTGGFGSGEWLGGENEVGVVYHKPGEDRSADTEERRGRI